VDQDQPRPSLFRAEALEAHAQGARPGRVVDLGQRRTSRAFLAVLAAVGVAVAASLLVRTAETTTGVALISPAMRGAVIALPVAASSRLAIGQRITVRAGGTAADLEITRIGPVVGPAQAASAVHADPGVGQAWVLVDAGTVGPGSKDGRSGRGTVVLDRLRVAEVLVPWVGHVLGD
jgi:hypothetical protein